MLRSGQRRQDEQKGTLNYLTERVKRDNTLHERLELPPEESLSNSEGFNRTGLQIPVYTGIPRVGESDFRILQLHEFSALSIFR